jgi:25S rRNA (adenine2142-N1)-methyltransferase
VFVTLCKLCELEVYQEFSKIGEEKRGFNSAQWIVKQLKAHEISGKEGRSLRLLDVGALGENYATCRAWIDTIAIDLHSCHPVVQKVCKVTLQCSSSQIDFFDVEEKADFDIVCLSLVINFVESPSRRGEMLVKTTQLLCPDGHVFIVLPLACVENSRYFNVKMFQEMLQALGFVIRKEHSSPKLYFVMAQMGGGPQEYDGRFPKKLVREGKTRNNFHIAL